MYDRKNRGRDIQRLYGTYGDLIDLTKCACGDNEDCPNCHPNPWPTWDDVRAGRYNPGTNAWTPEPAPAGCPTCGSNGAPGDWCVTCQPAVEG